jgi:hypothetical protein
VRKWLDKKGGKHESGALRDAGLASCFPFPSRNHSTNIWHLKGLLYNEKDEFPINQFINSHPSGYFS